MRIKYIISAIIFILTAFNGYSQDKGDSVRRVSWAVRIAAGVNLLQLRKDYKDSYDKFTKRTDGNVAQIGLKFSFGQSMLSTKGRHAKMVSYSSELNYIVSQYHHNYVGYVYLGSSIGTYYTAKYSIIAHSFQFSVLRKRLIGDKKIFYISMGPFCSKPFYYSTTGNLESNTTGTTSTNTSTKNYKNNEIITKVENFNFGAIANFGLDIPIKKQIFSIELRLQPGLSKTFSKPNLLNHSMLLSATYSFW